MLKNHPLFCPAAAVSPPEMSVSTQLKLSVNFNVFVHIHKGHIPSDCKERGARLMSAVGRGMRNQVNILKPYWMLFCH